MSDPDKELLEALQDHRRFALEKDLQLTRQKSKIERLEMRAHRAWQSARAAREGFDEVLELHDGQLPNERARGSGAIAIKATMLEWYAERLESKAEKLLFSFDLE